MVNLLSAGLIGLQTFRCSQGMSQDQGSPNVIGKIHTRTNRGPIHCGDAESYLIRRLDDPANRQVIWSKDNVSEQHVIRTAKAENIAC